MPALAASSPTPARNRTGVLGAEAASAVAEPTRDAPFPRVARSSGALLAPALRFRVFRGAASASGSWASASELRIGIVASGKAPPRGMLRIECTEAGKPREVWEVGLGKSAMSLPLTCAFCLNNVLSCPVGVCAEVGMSSPRFARFEAGAMRSWGASAVVVAAP